MCVLFFHYNPDKLGDISHVVDCSEENTTNNCEITPVDNPICTADKKLL